MFISTALGNTILITILITYLEVHSKLCVCRDKDAHYPLSMCWGKNKKSRYTLLTQILPYKSGI